MNAYTLKNEVKKDGVRFYQKRGTMKTISKKLKMVFILTVRATILLK